jgi:hypothetical protein
MMGIYLQSSTANPYGHRPWATRLYTSFDDFSYLKQPQNLVLKGNLEMRPEIYRPPEMQGLGDFFVFGSGRMMRSRRRSLRGLGMIGPIPIWRPPGVAPIVVGVMSNGVRGGLHTPPSPITSGTPGAPSFQGCSALLRIARTCAPGTAPGMDQCGPTGLCVPAPVRIYPPPMVPPVPTPVASGPGGTVWSLPGTPATPGSPYMPAPPSDLPVPGTPITPTATATVPGPASLADWFNADSIIAGWKNGYLLIGGGIGAWLLMRKRGRF